MNAKKKAKTWRQWAKEAPVRAPVTPPPPPTHLTVEEMKARAVANALMERRDAAQIAVREKFSAACIEVLERSGGAKMTMQDAGLLMNAVIREVAPQFVGDEPFLRFVTMIATLSSYADPRGGWWRESPVKLPPETVKE